MSIHETLNNQIVESLRRGLPEAVSALIAFGVRPTTTIDMVLPSGSSVPSVTSRSVWFWSHQAPKPDAVLAWWDWIDRHLESYAPQSRAHALAVAFADGLEAALPQEGGATLLSTWARALEWTQKEQAPGWSRKIMMNHLASCCSKIGNPSANGLLLLEKGGFSGAVDWSNDRRQKYAQDPMTSAISKGQTMLVEVLLDMGCSPTLQNGKPILSEVWSVFIESLSKPEINLHGENDQAVVMVESLLARGLDWDIPLRGGAGRTVAEDAHGWLEILKTQPNKRTISQHIEMRLLSNTTAPASRKKRSNRL